MKEYFFEERGIFYRKNDFVQGRPTLIFIHGVSASSIYWEPYENKFQNHFNVLSLDLRGHGKSKKFKRYDDYKIKNLADDVYALLSELKIEKPILICHSFATLVALEFMSEQENLLSAAVLLSPNYSVKKNWFGNFLNFLFEKNLMPLFFWPEIKGHVDHQRYLGTGDWNFRRVFQDILKTGFRIYFYYIASMSGFDRQDLLSKIKIPTLIIHGKKDGYFPVQNAIYMASMTPHSELHLLSKADHIIVLNNFPEISELIERFVQKI